MQPLLSPLPKNSIESRSVVGIKRETPLFSAYWQYEQSTNELKRLMEKGDESARIAYLLRERGLKTSSVAVVSLMEDARAFDSFKQRHLGFYYWMISMPTPDETAQDALIRLFSLSTRRKQFSEQRLADMENAYYWLRLASLNAPPSQEHNTTLQKELEGYFQKIRKWLPPEHIAKVDAELDILPGKV